MAEYGGKTVIFNREEDVNAAIQQYEEETVTHFVVAGLTPSYSQSELSINTIRWHLTGYDEGLDIPFDGVPFCWLGRKYLVCQFGKKKTYPKVKDSEEARKPPSKRLKTTKKFNCPAKVTIKKIVKFPDFKAEKNAKQAKTVAKNSLLAALKEDSDSVYTIVQFYVKFSAIEEHKNHDMGEDAAKVEPVDQRVKAKLEELAQTGVSSCTVLHALVHKYVENELFKDQPVPPKSRRRYFPKLKDVQNFMTRWKKKSSDTNPEQLSVPQVWEGLVQQQEEEVVVDSERERDQGGEESGEIVETESSDNILEQVVIHTQEVPSDSMQEGSHTITQDQVPTCTLIIHQRPGSGAATQEWTISNSQALGDDTQSLSTGHQDLSSSTHSYILNTANLQLGSSIQQLSNSEQLSSSQHSSITQQLTSTQQVTGNTQGISGNQEQQQIVVGASTPVGNNTAHVHVYDSASGSEQQEGNVENESISEQQVGLVQEQLAAAQSTDEEQAALLSLMNTVLLNSSLQQAAASRTSIPVPTTVIQETNKPKRKVQRIGLVRQMKEVMHDILDYSLLVKDVEVLGGLLANLEEMRTAASKNACLDPEVVQKELARNRRKRPAELHDMNTKTKHRATHLSDVL